MVYNHQQSEDFITLTHFSKLELPSSTMYKHTVRQSHIVSQNSIFRKEKENSKEGHFDKKVWL